MGFATQAVKLGNRPAVGLCCNWWHGVLIPNDRMIRGLPFDKLAGIPL